MGPRAAPWLVALAACGFHGPRLADDDASTPVDPDAAIGDSTTDASAPPAFCPTDPHLRLCYAFDQAVLPALLPDEGAAVVDAHLTNVQSMPSPKGRAAKLDATSEIWVPMVTEVTNIQAFEVWFRYDAELATNGGREGLVDSNVSPPNISLFFYRADPTHSLRCGLGGQVEVWPATLVPAHWYYAACVCDAGMLTMYLDGVQVGRNAGACASGGGFVMDGFTIGANNNGGQPNPTDWLIGEIDGVRLWDVTLPATRVCTTAGTCP